MHLSTSYAILARASFGAAFAALTVAAMADTSVAVTAPKVGVMARSTYTGPAPTTQKIWLTVGLNMANFKGLQAVAADVNNPKSLNYHHYLTPVEIGTRFGATSANAAKVVSYLGKYFSKVTLMDNHTAIVVQGTVGQAQNAFGIKIGKFLANQADQPVGSPQFYANLTAPKLPSTVASQVSVVAGLENFYRHRPTSTLIPDQVRKLYSVTPLYTGDGLKGEGVTVGITNFDGFRLSNIPLYYSAFGLPAPSGGVGSNISVITVAGGTGQTDPAQGEGDLDIQMVLGMVPKCTLKIYDAPNSAANGLTVLQQEVQDNAADVLTESYGGPLYSDTFSIFAQSHVVHVAMSAQGMTYLVASGDEGTYPAVVENPTSSDQVSQAGNVIDPDVLVVGGTVATTDNSGNRITEDGWVGSGGGWTTYQSNGLSYNVRPDWQKSISIPNDTAHNFRLYPDVALHACGSNNTFTENFQGAVTIFYSGASNDFAGTSAASPMFAGQLALMLQKLKLNGAIDANPENGLFRLGHIQEAIYGFAANPGATLPFFDITTGSRSNGTLPDGTASNVTPGYDLVTGLGAPILDGLYANFTTVASQLTVDNASAASIYANPSPQVTLGTGAQGSAADLASSDGVTYSLGSVKQSGVGQVAAAEIDFALQGTSSTRRAAVLNVSLNTPALTTGYVYIKNGPASASAGKDVYDLVKTITGSGATSSYSISLDLTKYVTNDSVSILVRGLKPTRIGSTPFRLSVDKATVGEALIHS